MKLFFEASPCFEDDDTDGREARRQRELDELDALLREEPESGSRIKAASLFAGLRGSIDVDWGPWPDEAPPTIPEPLFRPRLAAS